MKSNELMINTGHLFCASGLLVMGIASAIAQSSARVVERRIAGLDIERLDSIQQSWYSFLVASGVANERIVIVFGVLPVIGCILFLFGAALSFVKTKEKSYILVMVLSLIPLIMSFLLFCMIGAANRDLELYFTIIISRFGWGAYRILMTHFVIFQGLFVISILILLFIPFMKKNILYRIIACIVAVLHIMNLLYFEFGVDIVIRNALTGADPTFFAGTNFFGTRYLAIIIPVVTSCILICSSITKKTESLTSS